jgi:hypothetical protein
VVQAAAGEQGVGEAVEPRGWVEGRPGEEATEAAEAAEAAEEAEGDVESAEGAEQHRLLVAALAAPAAGETR